MSASPSDGSGEGIAADLRQRILRAELEAVAEHLATLAEPQRRRLSKAVWELHRALERDQEVELPEGASVWRRGRQQVIGTPSRVLTAAEMAVFGVCPWSRVRRLRLWFLRPAERRVLLRILRDRRPEWLGDWAEQVLEGDETGPIPWTAIRSLVRDGLCERPSSPAYIRRMAGQMLSRSWGPVFDRPLAERLLSDPGLLEVEIWRLFEVEAGPEIWYPTVPGTERKPADGWGRALCRLAASGRLDRQRLLDASLESLASGLAGRTLSCHRRLHEDLAPTLEEVAARQGAYRRLLGSRHGAVAGFGLKVLGRLQRAGRLEVGPFLAAVSPVFEHPAKVHAQRALGLVARCLRAAGPETRARAREAAAAALLHPSPEVQERALAVIEGMAGGIAAAGSAVREQLEQTLGFLAPPLARRLADRLGVAAPAPDEGDLDAGERQLRQRFAALSAGDRSRAGLDRWPDGLPAPWRPDFSQRTVLRDGDRIAPIEDWEELVDAVSHAVEIVDSATEIERLLGGLARLGTARPAAFSRRTEALAARLDQRPGGLTASGLGGSWNGAPRVIVDLLRTWLVGSRIRTRTLFPLSITGPFPFLCQRLGEVAERLVRGGSGSPAAGPLLAEPTHRRGWIDPRVLVERVAGRRGGLKGTREPADLIQALLRLAPDHRREALGLAKRRLEGFDLALIDFALGGERPPPPLSPRTAAVWLAAARARRPAGSVRSLLADVARSPWARAALAFVGAGPDALEPARYRWRATTTSRRNFWSPAGTFPHIEVEVPNRRPASDDPGGRTPGGRNPPAPWQPFPRRLARGLRRKLVHSLFAAAELPTSAVHRLSDGVWESFDQQVPWQVEWAAQVWPADSDAVLASGIRWISRGLDGTGAAGSPHHAYLGPLLDADRPWTEIAYLAAASGLLARDPEVRGVVVDALVEGIGDGRVHPRPLGGCLVGLWHGGWAKANRLTSGLDPVVRVGPLHELVVAGALDRLVASWEAIPHGAHLVFQMLDDALAALAAPVSEAAARVLAAVAGGGKTARLARSLAARRGAVRSPRYRRALLQAVEARIQRATVGPGPVAC